MYINIIRHERHVTANPTSCKQINPYLKRRKSVLESLGHIVVNLLRDYKHQYVYTTYNVNL